MAQPRPFENRYDTISVLYFFIYFPLFIIYIRTLMIVVVNCIVWTLPAYLCVDSLIATGSAA